VESHTAALWAYYLAYKSAEEILAAFKLYQAELKTQSRKVLKRIRINRGREWINDLWCDFCGVAGIVMEVTTPHSSSQNGLGKCGICSTLKLGCCLLLDSGLLKSMWPTAFEAATYL
jgi:hypothetical protein